MRREFLEDYEKSEEESRLGFMEKFRKGELTPEETYPPRRRFPRLCKPYAMAAGATSIWPQILPLGSLIIPIAPITKTRFKDVQGFDPSDISKLIDFHKDTGKVQFALTNAPTSYVDLDFLEPILTDIRPPVIISPLVPTNHIEAKKGREFLIEFDTLASVRFYKSLERAIRAMGAPSIIGEYEISSLAKTYIFLRAKGYDAIADDIRNSLVDNPVHAFISLSFSWYFIMWPQIQFMKAIVNVDKDTLGRYSNIAKEQTLQAPRLSFPCEIGSFLLEELSFLPEGFEACKDVLYHYDHRDVYKVMNAINEAAIAKNHEMLRTSSDELKQILNLVWQDAGVLGTRVKLARFLIPLSIGAVGMILDPAAGLMGALGFYVAEKISEEAGQPISESIIKSISPGYVVTLYDFKKKYELDRRPQN